MILFSSVCTHMYACIYIGAVRPPIPFASGNKESKSLWGTEQMSSRALLFMHPTRVLEQKEDKR